MSNTTPDMEGKAPDPQVMIQAERWWARLDAGDCSEAEMAAFERWHACQEHAAAYVRVTRLWSELGMTAGNADIVRLSEAALADTAPAANRSFRNRLGRWAAAACLCILVASAFYSGMRYLPAQTYATDLGQRSTVRLEDGSVMVMNVGTRIDVKFGKDRREIVLKAGEADFNVAKDPLRPFTVTAGDSEVTAFGTRFQVRHEHERVTVTLIEGRVAVDDKATARRVQLTPGEQVRLTEDAGSMQPQSVDVTVVASWTTGRLKFNATPLRSALEEVNRYSNLKIRLQDAELANTPVTGVFDVGDVDSVVSAVETMLAVEAVRLSRDEILLRSK